MEPARSLLWYAAHALDVLSNDAPRAAAMVKARMCEVYMRSADRAVLMHGGIGFTWDHDMHLWSSARALTNHISARRLSIASVSPL
jgi:alkylation response protein AidB-like acyl-CoA dehydrogenase